MQCQLTFRVAEPEARARHLRFCSSANAVTGQGLGGRSASERSRQPGVMRSRDFFEEKFVRQVLKLQR